MLGQSLAITVRKLAYRSAGILQFRDLRMFGFGHNSQFNKAFWACSSADLEARLIEGDSIPFRRETLVIPWLPINSAEKHLLCEAGESVLLATQTS